MAMEQLLEDLDEDLRKLKATSRQRGEIFALLTEMELGRKKGNRQAVQQAWSRVMLHLNEYEEAARRARSQRTRKIWKIIGGVGGVAAVMAGAYLGYGVTPAGIFQKATSMFSRLPQNSKAEVLANVDEAAKTGNASNKSIMGRLRNYLASYGAAWSSPAAAANNKKTANTKKTLNNNKNGRMNKAAGNQPAHAWPWSYVAGAAGYGSQALEYGSKVIGNTKKKFYNAFAARPSHSPAAGNSNKPRIATGPTGATGPLGATGPPVRPTAPAGIAGTGYNVKPTVSPLQYV